MSACVEYTPGVVHVDDAQPGTHQSVESSNHSCLGRARGLHQRCGDLEILRGAPYEQAQYRSTSKRSPMQRQPSTTSRLPEST